MAIKNSCLTRSFPFIWKNTFFISCACIILFILPIWIKDYVLHFLILAFLWAYLSQSWNIVGGFCGQLSLGHAAFFAVGAYTSSLLYVDFGVNPWLGILIGGIIGAALGLFIGFLSFRYGLKGPYFSLVTLAFAELLRVLVLSVDFTKGALGVMIPLSEPGLINFQFLSKVPYYYIILVFMLVLTLIVQKIYRSKMGYYFLSIRENEDAAEALGVNTLLYKLKAISISAFFTAIGGSFYAQYIQYITPGETFGWHVSVEMILRALVGGMGTVLGPLLGSLALSFTSEVTRVMFGNIIPGIHMIIYSIILILIVLYFPRGIFVWLNERLFTKEINDER
jgi:branched-chain amino acid transport system permease protein